MKNKSYIIAFIVALIAIILLFPKPQTPYSGSYHNGSANEELILNSDDSFDLHIDNYRNSTTICGKYKISNNHIELFANDKNDTFFIKNICSGEVTGSVITFKQDENASSIIFTKS